MKKTDESRTETAVAKSAFGPQLRALPNLSARAPGNMMAAWPQYMIDALQRSILFLDLLRQRGNEEIEITSRPLATVVELRP